eukprot:scaffold49476_cov39-Phaeocystis_antarctica.AAC.1
MQRTTMQRGVVRRGRHATSHVRHVRHGAMHVRHVRHVRHGPEEVVHVNGRSVGRRGRRGVLRRVRVVGGARPARDGPCGRHISPQGGAISPISP